MSQGNKEMSFTHYLLISRVYKFDGAEDDMDMGEDKSKYVSLTFPKTPILQSPLRGPASKKTKKAQQTETSSVPGGLMHYHPEEEFLERVRPPTTSLPP